MKNITLIVNKAYVYDEVAKTTAYAGLKMMAEDASFNPLLSKRLAKN